MSEPNEVVFVIRMLMKSFIREQFVSLQWIRGPAMTRKWFYLHLVVGLQRPITLTLFPFGEEGNIFKRG